MKKLILALALLPCLAQADPDLFLCAQYSLWLDSAQSDLSAFNSYVITPYHVVRSNPGHEHMQFDLPTDLVGAQKISVDLEVTSVNGSQRTFTGPLGDAICNGPWTQMACSFRFKNLQLDSAQVMNFLEMKYGSGAQANGMMRLASRFDGDPIGVAYMGAKDSRCSSQP